jgi:hypothetical protein
MSQQSNISVRFIPNLIVRDGTILSYGTVEAFNYTRRYEANIDPEYIAYMNICDLLPDCAAIEKLFKTHDCVVDDHFNDSYKKPQIHITIQSDAAVFRFVLFEDRIYNI